MSGARALPWTALVEAIGEDRFEEIRTAIVRDRADPASRDAFLMLAPAGALLREMMAPEAPAEAVHAYGALLHALYLLWDAGWPVVALDGASLDRALADPAPLRRPPVAPGITYVQLPARAVWAQPAPEAAHEPLDGCVVTLSAASIGVLAVLGFRDDREGFTTIEAAAPLPLDAPPPRPDGAAPFTSTLPSGSRAGLRSVATRQELLALALLARTAAAA